MVAKVLSTKIKWDDEIENKLKMAVRHRFLYYGPDTIDPQMRHETMSEYLKFLINKDLTELTGK